MRGVFICVFQIVIAIRILFSIRSFKSVVYYSSHSSQSQKLRFMQKYGNNIVGRGGGGEEGQFASCSASVIKFE